MARHAACFTGEAKHLHTRDVLWEISNLRKVANAQADIGGLRWLVEDADGAPVGADEIKQQADAGALAGAVGADQPQRLPRLHPEADALERHVGRLAQLLGVGLMHLLESEHPSSLFVSVRVMKPGITL